MRSLFYDKATRKKVFRRIGFWASLALLLLLLRQIHLRVSESAGGWSAVQVSHPFYLVASLLLLPAGFSVEAHKWRQLLRAAGAPYMGFKKSFISVLCGTAASAVTPNRVGDYPGRVLALKGVPLQSGTVAGVLGAGSQLATLFLWAIPAALSIPVSGNLMPQSWVAALAIGGAGISLGIYFLAHRWVKWLLRIPLLKRLVPAQQNISGNTPAAVLWTALGWSLLRFAVYTTQFWLLLHWLSVPMAPVQGWLRCAFFFSVLAVIPNFALAEIGIRGAVALFLFDPSGANSAAVFLASLFLWLTNLAVPSLVGALLWFRTIKPSVVPTVQQPPS